MNQLALFRTSILCKLSGSLVLVSVDPSTGGPLKCPICKGVKFIKANYGWLECDNCYHFALLESHVKEIESQWYGPIGI